MSAQPPMLLNCADCPNVYSPHDAPTAAGLRKQCCKVVQPPKPEPVTLWLLYRGDALCDMTHLMHKAIEWADYYSHPHFADHRVVPGVFVPKE
jgi:hypothetical protein